LIVGAVGRLLLRSPLMGRELQISITFTHKKCSRAQRPSGRRQLAGCASWCQAAQLEAHCGWCKCRSCGFCPGAAELAAAAKALLPPRYDCPITPPPRTAGPLRLTACGPDLYASDGSPDPVLLSGVGMYLEWRMPPLYRAAAMADIPTLRERIPSANLIRFVGVLWKDSIKESDGLECSTSDSQQPATCHPPAWSAWMSLCRAPRRPGSG
jgi:hypothetical protein